jgi:hypothetical protein
MSEHNASNGEIKLTSRDELHSTGTAIRVREAISAASIGSGSHEELDTAARDFVIELRKANEPPEQVLLAMKRILALAGLRPGHPPTDPTMIIERHSQLYRAVIASSIRHYFSSSDGDGAPA